MSVVLKEHITSNPEICGGKPCIAGTRIRVWDIYVLHELNRYSIEQILEAYPSLTLSDVYAALSYYFDNKQEIDAQAKADDDFVEQLKKQLGDGPYARKMKKAAQ